MIKTLVKRILILLAGITLSFIVPVLVKQWILKPIRYNIIGDNAFGQIFQWGFSLILIFSGYMTFVKLFEWRIVNELSMKNLLPHSFKGLLWGIVSIGGILLILMLTGAFKVIGFNPNIHSYQYILILFLLSTAEEILYRGLLFRLIHKWYGIVTALIVSSFLFSILHLSNDHFNIYSFLAILSGGMTMGLIFTITRSLWWPIAAHFSWNLTQVIMGVRLSGTDQFSNLALFNSSLKGNTLISGGDFGVENSLITITYTIILTVILLLIVFRKEGGKYEPEKNTV